MEAECALFLLRGTHTLAILVHSDLAFLAAALHLQSTVLWGTAATKGDTSHASGSQHGRCDFLLQYCLHPWVKVQGVLCPKSP